MKNIDLVWETLKNVMKKDLFDDVKEEIILTIEALKKNNFKIQYLLFRG